MKYRSVYYASARVPLYEHEIISRIVSNEKRIIFHVTNPVTGRRFGALFVEQNDRLLVRGPAFIFGAIKELLKHDDDLIVIAAQSQHMINEWHMKRWMSS